MKVRVIRRKGQGILVEWHDQDGYHRAVVPSGAVDGDFCDPEELVMGIPYGEPWAQVVGDLVIAADDVENELRKHGIWTIEDAREKPNAAAAALLAVHKMGVNELVSRAVAAKGAKLSFDTPASFDTPPSAATQDERATQDAVGDPRLSGPSE